MSMMIKIKFGIDYKSTWGDLIHRDTKDIHNKLTQEGYINITESIIRKFVKNCQMLKYINQSYQEHINVSKRISRKKGWFRHSVTIKVVNVLVTMIILSEEYFHFTPEQRVLLNFKIYPKVYNEIPIKMIILVETR